MNNNGLSLVSANSVSVEASVAIDDFIKSRIFTVRGVQVMIDSDLAKYIKLKQGYSTSP